ncbi:MAG: hypothetical protein HFACDABA_01646 [Anaerolineales bacterium]|nr:hypothetical protein [Anaerolineales bacterium]
MKSPRLAFVYILIFPGILACQLASPYPPPLSIPSAALTAADTFTPLPSATPLPPPTLTATPAPFAKRVIILSIDGLRPDAIELAPMPNLLNLMQSGAYSLTAQTIFPSSTLPSHSSMLTGLCPATHGVNWNDYIPENGIAQGTDLFDIAHAAGMKTAMYVGKKKLQQVTDASSVDTFVYVNDRESVLIDRLLADFPLDFGVLFIHFPTPDGMGHEYGWLSPQQFSVLFRADEALARLLAFLDANGLRSETLIIISADHGGHKTTHGTSQIEDMTIPWIASGPNVRPGRLATPIHTIDTAATAAFALGLPLPPEWDGVPVVEAFGLPVEMQSTSCR